MRTIVVTGASGSIRKAPFGDPDREFWGLGRHIHRMSSMDVLLEMHDRSIWRDYLRTDPNAYARQLARAGVPVYMREAHDDIPNSRAFPFEAIRDAGLWIERGEDYYVSSIAYMIALAILEAPDRIEVYGINLTSAREYVYQRSNTEYLLGFARGRGIETWVYPGSPLCRTGLAYGTREWFDNGADHSVKSRFRVSELMLGARAAESREEQVESAAEFPADAPRCEGRVAV